MHVASTSTATKCIQLRIEVHRIRYSLTAACIALQLLLPLGFHSLESLVLVTIPILLPSSILANAHISLDDDE